MASDDWSRNKYWNARIEERFFEKLARARSQRDQYLAIQAITIAPRDPETAIRLVDHYFETKKSDYHDVQALLAKVDAKQALGDMAGVITTYKEILAQEAEFPNRTTRAYVAYPYLVATKKIEEEYEYAIAILDKRKYDNTFPLDHFMWHASYALIASARGDEDIARNHSIKAVAAADAKKSGFRYHQNLGLVGKEHRPVLRTLMRLVAD